MDKNKAMKEMGTLFENDFQYLYKKQHTGIHSWNYAFMMDSKSHMLQMSLQFMEEWCDVLCFISPSPLLVNSEYYRNALEAVNYVNWHIKAWGRFYIDSYGDLAYSLRIKYKVLEKMPHESIKEIECAVDYYADLFVPLLNICQGKTTLDETKQFIDDIWAD